MTWTTFAADASSTTPFDFVQYGVLGLVIVGLLAGWLWAKPAVDQLKRDKEAAERQRDALIEVYEKQVIPVLSEVQRELVPTLRAAADQLKDAGVRLEALEATIKQREGKG